MPRDVDAPRTPDAFVRAHVVEAEAQVPLAIAEAFRAGNLGVMDFVRYRNVESDTEMRRSIATGEDQTGN